MAKDQDYFSDLPNEMVMKILLLLDYDSMLSARICCARFETLLTGVFEDRSIFKLNQLKNFKLAKDNSEFNWIFKTNKKLKNLCFYEFNFDDANNNVIDEFFDLHGHNIHQLEIIYRTVAEDTLNKILDKTGNLKIFKISLSRYINGSKIINKLYDRCVEISFATKTYIHKNEIEMISSDRKSTIEILNLKHLQCNESHENITPFRESGVYKLLKLIRRNLKQFEMYPKNADDNILQQLAELNLNLETFKICLDDEIENSCMLTIMSQMKNLQILEIQGTLISDENANVIYDNLPELRSLTFRECDLLGNEGITNVTKLKKLEEFTINTCQNVTNMGIVNGIASKPNNILKRLELYDRFSDDTLIAIVNNLPNLEALDISTILFFSPHLIPLIYERLTNLKELSVSTLHEPNDADIRDADPECEIAKNLPEPKLYDPDVRVSRLNKLLVLQMYGFKILPGATLLDIAKIPTLRHLTLHNYEEITKNEMIHLLKALPGIKKIDLRHCNDFLENDADRAEILANINPKIDFMLNFDKF